MITLIDKRFGKLTVIAASGRHRYFKCICDCGKEKEVRIDHLRSGATKTCGCSRKTPKNIKNLTGQNFGKLTVVHALPQRKNGQVQWRCKCVCGNYTTIITSYLTRGDTKSCGCYKKEVETENLIAKYEEKRDGEGKLPFLHKSKLRSDNKSGYKGVVLHKATNKWFAQLTVNGKIHRSSLYQNKKDAIVARKHFENQYLK